MLFLGMDTSTTFGSLALVEHDDILVEWNLNVPRTHGERLLPGIRQALSAAGRSLDQVDGLAVTTGPGSFTGLRIALSTAKALALATAKPLVGVPTLDVLAENLPMAEGLVCAAIDARKGEVFAALYRRHPAGGAVRLTDYLSVPPEELAERIEEPVRILGNATRVYGDVLAARCRHPVTFPPPECHHPRASVLCRLAVERHAEGGTVRPADLRAIYARPSDAELHRRRIL